MNGTKIELWSIVRVRGAYFNSPRLKVVRLFCDGRHEHAECVYFVGETLARSVFNVKELIPIRSKT